MEYEKIGRKADGFVMDVSFISVLKLLDNLKNFLSEDSFGIILIKPQFESLREQIEKKGVIKSSASHKSILKKVSSSINEKGYYIKGMTYSDIKGAKGNIEFLFFVTLNRNDNIAEIDGVIEQMVEKAHKELN
jgi:23S rRNA (cytidine1920-2'-O)/16S rRNA (cytidine1409-2'-O)-methyltransferase